MKRRFTMKVSKKNKYKKPFILAISLIMIMAVAGVVSYTRSYSQNLKAVDKTANREVVVGIPSGASLNEISGSLKSSGVIRAEWAFKRYVQTKELGDKLQAGTYRLNTSQEVPEIVEYLTSGKVAVDLFTILPGQRIDEVRKAFIDAGFIEADVDAAFKPEQYKDMPALVDKPLGASLEGYLYPDSFQKTADTKPETIIRASLAEMGDALTPELRKAYASRGLTTHQAITLASILEREVASQEDRAIAAQVFFKRMSEGIPLQSDVTVIYGMVIAGKYNDYVDTKFNSPYNTFLHSGLPVGPISNVTKSGLSAVAKPASTDYLYFVAGDGDDYGKTYFSETLEEHNAAINAHCNSCAKP